MVRYSLLLAVLLAACGGDPDPASTETALSRAEFVDVVVALRGAEMDLRLRLDEDSLLEARFAPIQESILSARGITEDQLHAFIDHHSDLDYQEALWDSISERLKRARDYDPGRDQDRAFPEPGDRPFPEPGRRGIRPPSSGQPGDTADADRPVIRP